MNWVSQRCAMAAGAAIAGIAVVVASSEAHATDRTRDFSWSINIGATSDYVFRGISQSAEDPALQGGLDVEYGIFYAGLWASTIDFGTGTRAEVDFYAGLKPKLGPVEFDLGVIYYAYPGSFAGPELDYVEFKAGASTTLHMVSLGATAFYSPEYTAKSGPAWTFEGTAGVELPAFGPVTPSISALVGTTQFEDAGPVDYVYWNAGIELAIDKVTLDFRYWDTDLSLADCGASICDERFVASVKLTLP
ncbi:MAG: TorF family putative porin [Hyphomicrobiaceae bacterium]